MFLVPTDTPGVNIVRNVGLAGEPLDEGSHALIHYEDVRVPDGRAPRRRGPGVRHRADPPRRRPHPPRHAHDRPRAEGDRHDVRTGAEPRDGGEPARRQAVRPGLHRRLVRAARAVPLVRAVHGVGDRQVQRLQAGPQGHRHREGRHADGAARHRLAGDAGARRARASRTRCRSPAWSTAPRSWGSPTARPRSTRSRLPREVSRLQGRRRTCGRPSGSRGSWKRPRRSSPSTSSTKWGTCDRHRPAGRLDGRHGPRREGRADRAPLHLGRLPERDLRDPPRRAARRAADPAADGARAARRRDPPRVADHRGARRHRRAPHPGDRHVRRHVGARARASTSWGSSTAGRRWGMDYWPPPFDTDLEARAGLAYQLVEGIALLSNVDWQAKGLAGPRPARRLPRTPGRPLDHVPRADQGPGAAGPRRRRRRGCASTARSTTSPG